ncbi:MAG: type II toxin-antitoxin system mRNA interferase toxin, RelE/StbE family [Patescibacteria group bacterium]
MIIFHRHFEKRYAKISSAQQKQVKERLSIFARNPFDAVLQNHSLHGKYQGYRSINISGDWRAVYKFREDGAMIFVDLGTHSELYS